MTKPKPNDVFNSLTGFDEIAVRRYFGAPPTAMAKAASEEYDVPMFLRSLSFVLARREGATDADAYKTTMDTTNADVMDAFEKDVPDAGEA